MNDDEIVVGIYDIEQVVNLLRGMDFDRRIPADARLVLKEQADILEQYLV